jgi:hypothetical protein
VNFAALSPIRQRIAIALAVSLAILALLMWLPPIQPPESEPELPPMVAKPIPLPQAPATPRPKTAAAPADARVAASGVSAAAEPGLPANPVAAAVATNDSRAPTGPVAAATNNIPVSAVAAASVPVVAEAAPSPRPSLPKHVFLKFEMRIGKNGMAIGEARHELKIDGGRYELTATTRTIGLARLVKSYRLIQTSSGKTDGSVLHPQQYSEDKENDGEQRKDSVKLDYAARQLLFASGRKMPLREPTQDMLSILYQIPLLPEPGVVLPVAVTNGRDWEKYRFEIVTDEELITPLGKLHTVHFRKLHPPDKEGLEIWFAQEYRLLPVKLRHIERDGSISGEAVITDIRIAEE